METLVERLEMIYEELDKLCTEMEESKASDKTKKQYQQDLKYFANQLSHFADTLYVVIENQYDEDSRDEQVQELVTFIREEVPYDKRAQLAWRTGISEVIE